MESLATWHLQRAGSASSLNRALSSSSSSSSSYPVLRLPRCTNPASSKGAFTSTPTRPCPQERAQGLVVPRAAMDLKQEMKEYAAAEKRWMAQVTEGKVKPLTPREAGYAYQLADNVLLDVRPAFERNKSWVKDSVWIPAFVEDKGWAPGSILSKLSLFFFGGWWSGAQLTKRNERFMADVVAQIPKTANIIVGCQRGLRSLAACEHLYKAGYRNLNWIRGGFDAADDEDFKREGPVPLSFGGLGGFSEFIGMTDPQRKKLQTEGLAYRALYFGRVLGVVVALDLLFVGYQQIFALLHPEP